MVQETQSEATQQHDGQAMTNYSFHVLAANGPTFNDGFFCLSPALQRASSPTTPCGTHQSDS